ncbi:ligase-associated DNA damage response endonuclease PdeM [Cereibacter sphaeroides]|uniref:ligase-associated DNA damage response endonuclease PdeM n=1 Tax=Rhodobacterales TaxID=204455 RepID=UPI000BBF24AF|nr:MULTISPECIES: ligase-associated DNA damage response endonuclease PdeM [Paracoccaceae]MCE6959397.1 ligase-associated DNA damage response endonuclease PdeM [Cereibacter sphaeroides]MCE6967403.1 ligase-associated DNA damage response endonuclease PdeM [Cereibacter sphaeroides]MCE6973832.1 ligase-associated DNA damage response endonuclease PdeM [Cereibacter sphaeroides]
MNGHSFTLAGAALVALPSGALWWPGERLLCVSDLHLGKSERLARRGGTLLPPYETRATLTRLDADLEATGAGAVLCLGDSFDDGAAAEALPEDERLWLRRLMAGRDWTWILGNHDPAPVDCGGTYRAEVTLGALSFRHIASGEAEVSGHYHPKCALAGKARPCFLLDGSRLILPAYGAYTGGLWCHDPALVALMRPGALAILTGHRALPVPMPRMAPQIRPRSSTFAR